MPISRTSRVKSVAGKIGDVVLTSADVGLGNVNNTSDMNKPVSTAQAAAIAAVSSSGAGTDWGEIQGTLTNQTDLNASLSSLQQAINTLNSQVSAINTAIAGVNRKPVANASSQGLLDVAHSATGNVISNDTDADGDTLSVIGCSYNTQTFSPNSVITTTYGTCTIAADGNYNFVPNSTAWALRQGQTGTVVIGYTISDGQGAVSSSTITFTITGQNNAPITTADADTTPYNAPTTGNVLVNDFDPDQGTLSLTRYVVFGDATIYSPGATATIAGVGTIQMSSNGAYTFTPNTGYSGSVPPITYTTSNGTYSSEGVLTLSVSPAPSDVLSDPVTFALTGSHATYNCYTDADLNNVPWGALVAGDVVNIHWKSTPYRAKLGLRGQGTRGAPIVVNGVTDSNGNRPIFDWSTGAFTADGCNPSGGFTGLTDVFGTTPEYGEGLGGIVIKRGIMDPAGTYVPKWIQIKNLEVRSPSGPYQTLAGATANFVGGGNIGNGIYFLMSEDCMVENCLVHDCCFGIFLQANNEEIGYTSVRPIIRNNRIWDNGISGSFFEHNCYIQSASPIIEGNFLGQNRVGSTGSTYKSRSAGEIFRYNWVESSAGRAIDFVQSEDNSRGIVARPDYPITWCYGNVIINDETLPRPGAYVPFHFGGDNAGEQEGSSTEFVPGSPYRSQLYFWNNTYYQRKTAASQYKTVFFDLSLRSTRVDAWNNIFIASGDSSFSWVEHAGILNLRGTNLVYGTINNAIAEALPVNYQVNKIGTINTNNPLVQDVNTRDFFLQYSSPAIDIGSNTPPPGLPDTTIATAKPVEYQPRKASNGLVVRTIDGPTIDLGATEYGVGYTPAPPPAPSVTIIPSITGNAVQGGVLTINNGTWIGRPTFTYQWKREGVDIAGATNQSYTSTLDDFHLNLTCTVTGTNISGSSSSTTGSVYIISASAPINTTLPAITGTATEGLTLTCSSGTWTNSPSGYSYQWLLDGSPIVGATSSTYTLLVGQGGHQISCRVTATNAYDVNTATSNIVTIAFAPADPDINGTFNFSAASGTLLSALSTDWLGISPTSTNRYECSNYALQCVAGTGANGESCYYIKDQGANQYTEARILSGWTGTFMLGLQTTDVISGYSFQVTPTSWGLRRGGIYQNGGGLSLNTSADLTVKLSLVGGVFTAWINGTQITQYTDSTPITGGGIYFSMMPGSNVAQMRMDYIKTQNV